jgi:dephospho-CoA kinase
MSVIIGLTGGIGSGKSIVAKVFENLGIPVFNADSTAKHIMNSSPIIKEKLISTFGAEVYTNNQDNKIQQTEILNRNYLSKIVFSDPYKLEMLNAIVHPVTIQASIDWAALQKSPYVIKEAALFFETGSAIGISRIIGVSAPKSLRIHRVMKRDQCLKEEVEKRMASQMDVSIKMKLCDWVIVNDDHQLVLPQVVSLHEKILSELI